MDIKQISRVCDTFRTKYKSILIQSGLTRFILMLLVFEIMSSALVECPLLILTGIYLLLLQSLQFLIKLQMDHNQFINEKIALSRGK